MLFITANAVCVEDIVSKMYVWILSKLATTTDGGLISEVLRQMCDAKW